MFTKINNKLNNKNNYLHYTDRCRQTATDTITEFCRISVLPLLGSVGIGQCLFSPTEYTELTFAGSWNVLEVTLVVGLVQWVGLKGIVHPKKKILSSFTHPQVVPNRYECLCSAEHRKHSEEYGKQSSSVAPLTSIVFLFFFPTMEVNVAPKQSGYKLSLKYLLLCTAEQRHSYMFGTTWGWVNYDIILICGWTIHLTDKYEGINRQQVAFCTSQCK